MVTEVITIRIEEVHFTVLSINLLGLFSFVWVNNTKTKEATLKFNLDTSVES